MREIDAHQLDEDEQHDHEVCELCLERDHGIQNDCRCGRCCEALFIEVSLRDANREPRVAAECGPLYDDVTGDRVRIGFLLNDKNNHYACHFFDHDSRLCTIYETRPLCCRVFDCSQYEHAAP